MTKDITLEKLASIPSFMMLLPNNAKDKLGFYWNKTKRNEFYVLDLKTLKYEQITDGELPKAIRAGYVWLKDDMHITYTKDKDGDEQHDMYLYNIKTKESTQLCETPKAQEYPQDVSPDGKKIVFSSNRHGQLNLFILLTANDKPIWGLTKWNKDGWIYYVYNDTYNIKNSDVWAIKEDGSEVKKVFTLSAESNDTFNDISNDGKLLAISSDQSGINRAGILNLETEEIKWFGEGIYEETAIDFSDDGKKLVVLQNKEAEIRPIIYDVETGEARDLNFKGLTYFTSFCLKDKYLVYMRTDPTTPMILARYNLETNEEEVIIPPQTDLNKEDFYEIQYIKYPTFDGRKIGAILYTPKLEKGKKYPALVHVHGGPTAQFFQTFDIFS
ncbi:MAG: hypothetical protein ACTSP3_17325, partial [Candidatus Heimdallarchaeaceae archaeon]